jgi:hypothetical protein
MALHTAAPCRLRPRRPVPAPLRLVASRGAPMCDVEISERPHDRPRAAYSLRVSPTPACLRNSPRRLYVNQRGLQTTRLPIANRQRGSTVLSRNPAVDEPRRALQRAPRPQPTRRFETLRSWDFLKTAQSGTSGSDGASCGRLSNSVYSGNCGGSCKVNAAIEQAHLRPKA